MNIKLGIILLCAVQLLTGCTSVTVTHPNGTIVDVKKFHPMGEELSIDGVLDGVGTLAINKSTQDSQAAVDAIVNGIVEAATP